MGYISDAKSFKQFMKHMEQTNNNQEYEVIPSPKDYITRSVMIDLKERADRGYIKYGTTLNQNNHQNMLQHMYEEALDFAQYLKKEITTLNTIQDLVNKCPNDTELGEVIRAMYGKK
jgi:hypothetical protein